MVRTAVLWVCLATSVAFASLGFDHCTKHFVGSVPSYPYQPLGSVSLCRDGYLAIAYDLQMSNPAWVAVKLTPHELAYTIPGRDHFYMDPDLSQLGVLQAPVNSRAFNRVWNRGHLAASRLMSYSMAGKHASFTMANVAPQHFRFNQDTWNKMEAKTFDWIRTNRTLHLMMGVAYRDRSRPTRAPDNVAVPDYFFQVLCDPVRRSSVAFIGSNDASGAGIGECRSVSEVEDIFGGKLFPNANCNTRVVDYSMWWCPQPWPTAAPSSLTEEEVFIVTIVCLLWILARYIHDKFQTWRYTRVPTQASEMDARNGVDTEAQNGSPQPPGVPTYG
jgi:hypothetical protein